ncbi:PQ loop repeat-domain-containing protein [Neohortaea acidophila]|uniref:PQ loop repeat-domain-containing protein n=1 Tax=Neohortaea acidophila TaxID=245834 RepID=A0A6A6Q1N6_9PEZI|nr:PQ loop repeat-domain-containing protein [Neohortaea acidophila]KAF2486310.1 PQ loop repeat-domain-containing protein [Neohortaea acidophila]
MNTTYWPPASIFQPALPPHCSPTNDFFLHVSSILHVCIPTPLAFLSNALGIVSIFGWLFAQLPQIYKNWSVSSTSGLSFYFLLEWCLGDACNLLGAIFTHQASWQVAIGSYYVFVDLCLVGQWLWYEKLRHGNRMRKVGKRKEPTTPRIIFRQPTFHQTHHAEHEKNHSFTASTPTTIYRAGGSSFPTPSPRTLLLIACLTAMAQASPLHQTAPLHPSQSPPPTPSETAGTILAWTSTALYLASRLPQLLKNWRRQSTAGLSPQLFAAAFSGNLFYSLALLTNPRAWYDFRPYGGNGWVGSGGSERKQWIAAALPFFLGAAGVLGLDASVGLQFVMYGGEEGGPVVVVEEGKVRRWRRVSGWMRGWMPRGSEDLREQRPLLAQAGEAYGT